MSKTLWIWGAMLAIVAAACGGGTDGQPVPPPMTPAPLSPETPARSVGAQVWLRTGGGYYAGDKIVLQAFFEERVSVRGVPRLAIEVGDHVRLASYSPWVEEEIPPEQPFVRQRFAYEVVPEDDDRDGISIAADAFDFSHGALLDRAGLELEVEIHSVGAWLFSPDPVSPGEALWSHYVTGTPRPRVCTNERERALSYNADSVLGPPVLIEEWNGTPFLFYFTPGYTEDDRQAAEHSLDLVEDFSERVKDQLGYSILEVGGWIENVEWSDEERDCSWRIARQITGIMDTETVARVGTGYARPKCALYLEWAGALEQGFGTVHELYHLFGFAHHPESSKPEPARARGVSMSHRLTDGGEHSATYDDIDALRCIFPETVSVNANQAPIAIVY